MKYQGIIFDLDGVICSTDEYHYQAWKALAEEIGILAFTRADNARQRGISRMESLEILLEKSARVYTQEEKRKLAAMKNEIYRALLSRMTPKDLPDEVSRTLHDLRCCGVLLAIGSSSKNTPYILERIGLDGFFDAVSDGNSISRSKPDPEVFLNAAQLLGLPPTACLVVEDAPAGIAAGIAGGFDTAAIGCAALYGRASYTLSSFSELLEII